MNLKIKSSRNNVRVMENPNKPGSPK